MEICAYDGSGPLVVLPGYLSIECRLVLTVNCPRCGALHRNWLEASDHPELTGDRLWALPCAGGRCIARAPRAHLAAARQLAERLAAQYGLEVNWALGSDHAATVRPNVQAERDVPRDARRQMSRQTEQVERRNRSEAARQERLRPVWPLDRTDEASPQSVTTAHFREAVAKSPTRLRRANTNRTTTPRTDGSARES